MGFAIIRVKEESAALAHRALAHAYHRRPATVAQLATHLADAELVVLVAMQDEEPVAYLHAQLMSRLDGQAMMLIYDIAVHSEARRRGIGSALMARAIDIAGEAGATRCWLVAEPEDEAAIAFYEALGGESFGAVGYSWEPSDCESAG